MPRLIQQYRCQCQVTISTLDEKRDTVGIRPCETHQLLADHLRPWDFKQWLDYKDRYG